MSKLAILIILIFSVLIAEYHFRYTYKTAYACIYKIDNLTNKTFYSCGGDDWMLINHRKSAEEYLND